MSNPLRWFLTGPDTARIKDPAIVKATYRKRRIRGVTAMTIGYAMYYVMRLPLGVAKAPLLDEGLSATQLGTIGAAMTIAIAFGKFFNGFIGDHANIRKIIPVGLLGAAVVNTVLGLSPVVYVVFLVMWVLNGCFQSMGSAPATVSLSQWFPKNQLATWYGFFGIAHYLGEGLTFVGTSFLVAALGWRSAFLIPGLICIALAFVIFHFMNDRPQTYGLPSANEYAGEVEEVQEEKSHTTREAQIEAIKNPFVWCAALSAVFLGIIRYSVDSWGVIFLQEHAGYTIVTAGSTLGIISVTGGIGSVLSGIISDKVFRSRHAVTAIAGGILMLAGLMGFVTLFDNRALCMASAGVYGFALGIELSFLGGMLAVSLVSQKATGAAMGMVGLLAYFGATLQEIVNGRLMDLSKVVSNGVTTYDFSTIIQFWVVSTALMVAFVVPVLIAQIRKEHNKHNAAAEDAIHD